MCIGSDAPTSAIMAALVGTLSPLRPHGHCGRHRQISTSSEGPSQEFPHSLQRLEACLAIQVFAAVHRPNPFATLARHP